MKLSRIVLSALLAGGIVIGTSAVAANAASSSDSGYRAPGVTATVSSPTVAPGQAVEFVVNTTLPNVTLTVSSNQISSGDIAIAGAKSLTKATTNGSVTFSVTLSASGTATLVATNPVTRAVIATQVVTVADPNASAGALASTGSNDTLPIALGAAGLVVVGAGAVVVARRRRAQQF